MYKIRNIHQFKTMRKHFPSKTTFHTRQTTNIHLPVTNSNSPHTRAYSNKVYKRIEISRANLSSDFHVDRKILIGVFPVSPKNNKTCRDTCTRVASFRTTYPAHTYNVLAGDRKDRNVTASCSRLVSNLSLRGTELQHVRTNSGLIFVFEKSPGKFQRLRNFHSVYMNCVSL